MKQENVSALHFSLISL